MLSKKKIRAEKRKKQRERRTMRKLIEQEQECIDIIMKQVFDVNKMLHQARLGETTHEE